MSSRFFQAVLISGGVVLAGTATAAPAPADPGTDAFLAAVSAAGVGPIGDPARAIEIGKSVCPMLAEPGQTVADVAATVGDTAGIPLGAATMFTGIAISMFCPAAVDSVGSRLSPLPLLGF